MLWMKGTVVWGSGEQKTGVWATESFEVGLVVLKLGKGPVDLSPHPMVAAAVALIPFELVAK
jgi:hypothetical protein